MVWALEKSVNSSLRDPEEDEVGILQEATSPVVESPDLGGLPQPDTAFCPVVEEVTNSSRSVSPELGDSAEQDMFTDNGSEVAKSPDGSKAEEPAAALESSALCEMDTGNTTPEPSAVPDPEEEDLEPGEVKGAAVRRRVATPEEVRFPLLHGWRREVRIKKGSHRWQGETWYYAPCGKRMKQFPEVIKYLTKYSGPHVRREHFSFSPRMPVGDFYEERHTPEGTKWILLNSEEIPSRILAITGKRGRPRNMEKAKAKESKVKRGRGRPPKVKMIDLLNKPDAKLLRKLENQDILSDVEKVKLSKLRKKMRRKEEAAAPGKPGAAPGAGKGSAALRDIYLLLAPARSQEAKEEAAKKLKLREKREKEKEEKERKLKEAEQLEIKKKEKAKRKLREKDKVVIPPVPKPDRKQLAQQRRLEERKRQQFMLEELKKPTEDMCLPDHQPLPDFPPVPGVVLPGSAFHHCLMTVEFLQTYGKVFGLNDAKDVPSLFTLQEGLFNMGDSLGEVQDLLVKLLRVALFDPGLPSFFQSLKLLGEKVSEILITRENVSEILRIFLEAYSGDIELCDSLRTHPFQAHPPHSKAAVLAFLINELNASTLIISEIDKTLENMSNYRKNKWIIEGKIRRLKFALGNKKVERPDPQVSSAEECRTRRSTRIEENEDAMGDESALLKADEEEEVSSNVNTLDLERQIEKLTKRQMFLRKKIISCSQRLRCMSLGQDRYRRFYWLLPHIGGIFVEGSTDGCASSSLMLQRCSSFPNHSLQDHTLRTFPGDSRHRTWEPPVTDSEPSEPGPPEWATSLTRSMASLVKALESFRDPSSNQGTLTDDASDPQNPSYSRGRTLPRSSRSSRKRTHAISPDHHRVSGSESSISRSPSIGASREPVSEDDSDTSLDQEFHHEQETLDSESVNKALNLEKEPLSKTDHAVSFKRTKRAPRVFATHPEFKEIVESHRIHPDK
ncbi:unnamed protein product [Ranitomeya imitator]|uniref:Bromodomain adjacent to zinc finger domain protein 2A n=1 Tax=Ranitomeya imitator TaxID=111125 RepID=A0ABN9L164_9NEOB|nr:unnamed protein product [Ranitomeya imitator]